MTITTPSDLSYDYGLPFCMDAVRACLEGRVALDEVLRRWPRWEVDYDHAVPARTSTVGAGRSFR